MNEYLPYEEQLQEQLKYLPLPDENMAWADMKRRLEDDEDRKPFFWWKGCAGWGLLGILLLGLGWWLLRPGGLLRKKQDTENVLVKNGNGSTISNDTAIINKKVPVPPVANTTDTATVTMKDRSTDGSRVDTEKIAIEVKEKEKEKEREKDLVDKNRSSVDVSKTDKTKEKKKINRPVKPKYEIAKNPKPANVLKPATDTVQPVDVVNQEPGPIAKDRTALVNRDTVTSISKTNPGSDSVIKGIADTVAKASDPVEKENKPKKDSSKKNTWEFNIGLGMHQYIPLAGQKFTPYNSLGRKGSIADYIPSLYARAGRKDKWFFQAEFRYGAPQYTKEFKYRQTTVPDTGTNPRYSTITSSTLKKTFYHQLPLTFHYYIRPGWSVGAGFQWNRFSSAVSERETIRRNNFTQIDSLAGKSIYTEDTAGSVFRKSYWQAVAETQYQWKRFSVGMKYAFGLEPYIRFALPGQPVREERNHALQVFIRYQLWRSKR